MNPNLFRKHFEPTCEAPDTVPRLGEKGRHEILT